MKSRQFFNWLLVAALAIGLGPALAQAQNAQGAQSTQGAQNQPTPGVGRVSLIHGNVTVQRGDTGDWEATRVNAPLMRGDRIATGNDSRVEVQLDYADVLRLDHNSVVKVADLTRDRIQLQLAQGTADVAVFQGGQAAVEMDTPNMAVEPQGPGTFRIQVDSPELTEVIVRRGQAQVSTPQGSTTVNENQDIQVEGTNNPQYKVGDAPRRDAWDQWNEGRDKAILNAENYKHVNRYYTGAQDLGRYGSWNYVPGYDWCWTPYVDAGWVPYRDGRWIYEPYYGWTWVSYEPWGWAPYHYGRWFYWGGNWSWWPGYVTAAYYPLWAPAYVSFFGFGYGWYNFGYGWGYGYNSIGWCPLGPRDHYHRWWGRGDRFHAVDARGFAGIGRLNRSRGGADRFGRGGTWGSNLRGAFHNNHILAGITATSTHNFMNGYVPRNARTVQLTSLRSAHVMQGTLPVVPTRQSLRTVNRPARMAGIPGRATRGERFFTRQRPPAGPQSFSQQRAGIRRMVENRNTYASTRAASRAGARGTAAERGGIAAPRSNMRRAGGWRDFGGQSSRAAAPRGNSRQVFSAPRSNRITARESAPRQTQTARPGWTSFSAAPRGTARQQTAPRSGVRSRGEQAPRSFNPRAAPSNRRAQPSRGWRQFTPRSGPQARPNGGNGQVARPGWNRFPSSSRGERNSGWNAPAPRSRRYNQPSRGYERPPLQIRKPIVVERSPRSYGRGNYSPRSYSPRSYGGGNRGSWGGARSAPRSYGRASGGGGRAHASGGHRGGGHGRR